MKRIALLLILLSHSVFAYTVFDPTRVDKTIIGQSEYIKAGLGNDKLEYLARIDTGARVTSLHAFNTHVINGVDDMKANNGKYIQFSTANEDGIEVRHQAKIINVSRIKQASGSELRYSVVMDISFNNETRAVPVTLRDRDHMTYKLLIGRNWISHCCVVDVTQDAHSRLLEQSEAMEL
ncbi:ATP-dependent zinc protease [Vibrio breoganii]